MIGQRRVKRIAKLALKSGSNLVIVAPSGHGKSMLARELSGIEYVELEEPSPPHHILDFFEWNTPGRNIVCDEIHICNKQDEWAIFLDKFLGEVIFTTTDPDKVRESIKTRSMLLELSSYSLKELAQIAEIRGRKGKIIAILARGIPRKAKNLGILFKKFGGPMQEFLDFMGVKKVDKNLLFPEEIAYINALKGGAMGKMNLQRVLNLANINEVELSLLRMGVIEISHAGRNLVR